MAYIRFADPADGLGAFEAMDGKDFQGRLLHILAAIEKRPLRTPDEPTHKKSLKDALQDKRKANAGNDFNWAMLYMNVRALAARCKYRLDTSR